ncbi:hypothetical protein JNUCC64_31440 [Streptomyces sp. JNUCC 64]
MFRTRTAAVAAAVLLPVLGGAPGAAAVGGPVGASAAVTPSVVAPGGSFTLIVDCSAVAEPAPRVLDSRGVGAPLTLSPAGAGRFQAAGRLARELPGAVAVVIDGDCGGPDSRWIAGVLVGGPTATPAPTATRTPAPTASVASGPATATRVPSGTARTPVPGGSPTAGGVRGGLGGAFGDGPTRPEVLVGAGLLALGALGAAVALRRRIRARRR